MDDARLAHDLAAVVEIERDIRQQVRGSVGNAFEQARGQLAFRHAIALRKALEAWSDTRAAIAQRHTTA